MLANWGSARVEKRRLTRSTKGRSELKVRSDSAISSSEAPMCTVAARKHSGAVQGIGALRA